MLGLTDTTYDYIIDQKSSVLPSPYTMGGYPGYSSAYNAGYYSAALTGEKWRDGGIKAYQWMIDNAQSSPFGWWESINWPNTSSPWEQQQCDGGGSSQHMWGQSVATKILIDSFLAEKADGSIIAGRGIPAEWNAAGETVEIKDWLCNSGKKIGFTMSSTDSYIDFTLTGDKLENSVSLELIALKNNIRKVEGAGCTFDREKGTVLIPAGTTSVRVILGQPVTVTSVTLDKSTLELVEEETAQLTATVLPENADDKTVTWTSSNETVATVDENGLVTAVGKGTATITVTTKDGNKTATCEVKVTAKTIHVSEVTLDKSTLELVEEETAQLTATVLPENADDKSVTWTSSDETVATVDENGLVTAVGKGTVTITVTTTDGGKTAICEVTVKAKPFIPITPGRPSGSGSTSSDKLPFTDVGKYDDCYDAVKYLYERDIMNGTSATQFSPDATLTRGMVVTILYRMEGEPFTTGAKTFSDVKAGRYYSEAVEWAAENDIVNGFKDGTFKPDQAVTREQLAAILSRYASRSGVVIYAPSDALAATDIVSNWAKKDVAWAAAEGILMPAQTADATKNATRAEVAMALYTYLKQVSRG